LENARRLNVFVQHGLERAGADDPADADRIERLGEELAAEFRKEPLSLERLTSPKARRFAEAIRAAATACREMEAERGIEDGLAEILSDYADGAEFEVFGP